MISLEKWFILAPLLKLPKNVVDLGKFIVAKGLKKLPKVQKIANSGHTGQGFPEKKLSSSAARWLDYFSIFGHGTTMKIVQLLFFAIKWFKTFTKYGKLWTLKICQSCGFSPNLVTLQFQANDYLSFFIIQNLRFANFESFWLDWNFVA